MEYNIPVKQENYTKAILKVINIFMDLTNYELNIITQIIDQDIKMLNRVCRKILIEKLETDSYTLNNYIKKLKDKGVLVTTKYGLELNPNIINSIKDNKITITFNIQ